jgi:hypothetical protein
MAKPRVDPEKSGASGDLPSEEPIPVYATIAEARRLEWP